MQRSRASRWHSIQLVHIEDSGGPEGIRSLPVNVTGKFDIIIEPEGLQGDGVAFEVVQHGRYTVKPQVLDVASTAIHCHTQVLEGERERIEIKNRCLL